MESYQTPTVSSLPSTFTSLPTAEPSTPLLPSASTHTTGTTTSTSTSTTSHPTNSTTTLPFGNPTILSTTIITSRNEFPLALVVGIAVGAGVLCLLIVGIGLLWLRRQRARQAEEEEGSEGSELEVGCVGVDGDGDGERNELEGKVESVGELSRQPTPPSRPLSRLSAFLILRRAPPQPALPPLPPSLPPAEILALVDSISDQLTYHARTFFLDPENAHASRAALDYRQCWELATSDAKELALRTAPVRTERLMCSPQRWLIIKAALSEAILRAEIALEFLPPNVKDALKNNAWTPRERITYILSQRPAISNYQPALIAAFAESLDAQLSPFSTASDRQGGDLRVASLQSLLSLVAAFSLTRLLQQPQYIFFWDLPDSKRLSGRSRPVMALKRSFDPRVMEEVGLERERGSTGTGVSVGSRADDGIVGAVVMPGVRRLGDERGRGVGRYETVLGKMEVLMVGVGRE